MEHGTTRHGRQPIRHRRAAPHLAGCLALVVAAAAAAEEPAGPPGPPPAGAWAGIRVIDRATGRGVPLAELRTVHGLLFVADDAGRVAFREPGLLDRPVYFHLRVEPRTVRWNAHRGRYVMVAGEIGGSTSHLGEVWYAEADAPTGPFATAVKIATHDRTSFSNVCHHDFLDRDGGRTIHFEGTFSRDFSGGAEALPRADYNQVLYRLDLDRGDLAPARGDGG